jgi:hypothetical protein
LHDEIHAVDKSRQRIFAHSDAGNNFLINFFGLLLLTALRALLIWHR